MGTIRKHTQAMTRVVDEAGRCELCGSKRGLEAHHIVPVVCGGDDREENLICVCQTGHARLTPRAYLCTFGIEKVKANNQKQQLKIALYERIDQLMKERPYGGIDCVFDAIEEL